ncbi:unnamed protein product [Closterium sp. Naga37s-1]|nr:unnamed protein product [Closterium sp. Naga37s-1]
MFLKRPPEPFLPPLPSLFPPPSRSPSRRLRALPPVAFALSLPSPSRSPSRRLSALPPVAFALSLPSPLRSPSHRLRALPLLAFALSLASPFRSPSVACPLSLSLAVRSPSRRLRALPPVSFALSLPSPFSFPTSLSPLPSPKHHTLSTPLAIALTFRHLRIPFALTASPPITSRAIIQVSKHAAHRRYLRSRLAPSYLPPSPRRASYLPPLSPSRSLSPTRTRSDPPFPVAYAIPSLCRRPQSPLVVR